MKKILIISVISIALISIISFIVIYFNCNTKLAEDERLVTFNYDNGDKVTKKVVKVYKTVDEPNDPTKEGYMFAGWYNDGEYRFSFNTAILEDTTLIAKWIKPALDALTFKLSDDGEYYIVSGKALQKTEEIAIPNTYKGKPVKEIADNGFRGFQNLYTIVIPKSIELIGSNAFNSCSHLNNIYFESGSNLQIIKESAFNECNSLHLLDMPDKVERIEKFAFRYCKNLSSLFLSKSLKYVGKSAFNSCEHLMFVDIPGSVEIIDDGAFSNCNNLSSVTFDLDGNLEEIGYRAFGYPDSLSEIILPNNLKKIGEHAFYCYDLKYVYIPKSVEVIGRDAFCLDTDFTIYCEIDAEPDGWRAWCRDSEYYYDNIIWGYSR